MALPSLLITCILIPPLTVTLKDDITFTGSGNSVANHRGYLVANKGRLNARGPSAGKGTYIPLGHTMFVIADPNGSAPYDVATVMLTSDLMIAPVPAPKKVIITSMIDR